jgi:hypothetical protein
MWVDADWLIDIISDYVRQIQHHAHAEHTLHVVHRRAGFSSWKAGGEVVACA